MTRWLESLSRRLGTPGVMLLAGLLAILVTHLPPRSLTFSTDDYLIAAQVRGDAALAARGFATTSPDRPLTTRLADAFHFYSDADGSTATYRAYGNLPWWSSEHALMHPFRPIAAFTHWTDTVVFGASPWASGLTSFACLMLLWMAALRLGRILGGSVHAAGLYAALLVFDLSLLQSTQWLAARNAYLAVAFGLLSLTAFIRWRTEADWRQGLAAWAWFLAGLLTAEASIALPGYLLAWLLFNERAPRRLASLGALLPFIALVLVWRWAYNRAGFGSHDIGLYVDPGRSPVDFLHQVLHVVPCIITSLMTGVDALVSSFSLDARPAVRLVAWGVTLAGLWLVRDVLRTDRTSRSMLVGSLLATIPHATLLSAGPRSGTFVAIGFFWVMTRWLALLATRATHQKRYAWMRRAVLGWHLVIPLLAALALSLRGLVAPPAPADEMARLYQQAAGDGPPRPLVIVNPPAGYSLFYLPFEQSWRGLPLPDQLRAMAPGLTPLTLSRTAPQRFELRSPTPLAVNHEVRLTAPGTDTPVLSLVHARQLLQGLITTPAQRYATDRTLTAGGMTVTPLDVHDGLPLALRVDMPDDPGAAVWIAWDWTDGRFERIDPPEVGHSTHFAGPFSPRGPSGTILTP